MVPTYSEYIGTYLSKAGLKRNKAPGEHHFVSVYLVPLLYRINRRVPDYVNPDGTKKLIGDVIYFVGGEHGCGIEVKLGTVRLTKAEFNSWIVGQETKLWPNIFVGVGLAGVLLLEWKVFRAAYVRHVGLQRPGWSPEDLEAGYGPMKSVDVLSREQAEAGFFKYAPDGAEAAALEAKFVAAMTALLVNAGVGRHAMT